MIVLLIEHILKVDKHENNTIFVELININKSSYFFVFCFVSESSNSCSKPARQSCCR